MALDYKLIEFAGGRGFESIEVLDMAWGDFQESFDESIQNMSLTFDDHFHATVRKVFDRASDRELAGQISDSRAHPDPLNPSV
jgi:hypothetical protein